MLIGDAYRVLMAVLMVVEKVETNLYAAEVVVEVALYSEQTT